MNHDASKNPEENRRPERQSKPGDIPAKMTALDSGRLRINDWESYFEVDQALLKQQIPSPMEKPALLSLDAELFESTSHSGIIKEAIELEPQKIIITGRSIQALSAWTDVQLDGISLWFRCRLGLSGSPSIDSKDIPVDRLCLDFLDLPEDEILKLLQRSLDGIPENSSTPVKIYIPVSKSGSDYLKAVLDMLSKSRNTVDSLAISFQNDFPHSAESYRWSSEILADCPPSVRLTTTNYYRMVRLHLFHRLPLFGMTIDKEGTVFPFDSSPVSLGSLSKTTLGGIWSENRSDFWERKEVRESFLKYFRQAEMTGIHE